MVRKLCETTDGSPWFGCWFQTFILWQEFIYLKFVNKCKISTCNLGLLIGIKLKPVYKAFGGDIIMRGKATASPSVLPFEFISAQAQHFLWNIFTSSTRFTYAICFALPQKQSRDKTSYYWERRNESENISYWIPVIMVFACIFHILTSLVNNHSFSFKTWMHGWKPVKQGKQIYSIYTRYNSSQSYREEIISQERT